MWSIFIFAADPSFADDMINGFSKSGHMLISGKHRIWMLPNWICLRQENLWYQNNILIHVFYNYSLNGVFCIRLYWHVSVYMAQTLNKRDAAPSYRRLYLFWNRSTHEIICSIRSYFSYYRNQLDVPTCQSNAHTHR